MADEIGDQLGAVGCVHDLGVELGAIIAPLVIGDQGEGGAVAGRHDPEARGEAGDLVAMAHPDLMPLPDLPEAVEQHAAFGNGQIGAAELAALAGLVARADLAAELVRHHLLAVADAEDRQAAVEQDLRRAGTAFLGHAGRRSRQDDALGLQPVKGLLGAVERSDLRIDPGLADPAGDKLRDLRAEIDDQDGFFMSNGHGSSA